MNYLFSHKILMSMFFTMETVASTLVLSNLAKTERSPVQSGWKSGPVFGELLPISCIIGSPDEVHVSAD